MTQLGNRAGFALMAALWLLVLISTLALELGRAAHERRLAAANFIEATRTSAAARAGLAHAHARLEQLLTGDERFASRIGQPMVDPWGAVTALASDSVALGQVRYRLTMRDAGAALNLNTAGEEELKRFFRALRVDYGAADRLSQSIIDFRDHDDFRHARGAERADYIRLGRSVLPRNEPFAEIGELRDVLDMTPELFEQARPYITLLGTGQINLNAAPTPVLLSVPGIGDEVLEVLLRYRRQGRRLANLQELSNELPSAARPDFLEELPHLMSRATTETREVVIRSEGWLNGSPMHTRAEGLAVRSGTTMHIVWSRID